MRDQTGGGAWLLILWGIGMIPTVIWIWFDDWPDACAASPVRWADCLGEAVLLALLSAVYGFFWPAYWFVRLIV